MGWASFGVWGILGFKVRVGALQFRVYSFGFEATSTSTNATYITSVSDCRQSLPSLSASGFLLQGTLGAQSRGG